MDAQPIEVMLPGHPEDAEADSDHAAVERHAAVPQPDDLDRIGRVEFRPVEEHIAEPAAEQDAERGVEYHVVGVAPGHRRAGLGDQLQQIPPADDDAGEIGQRIPSELEETKIERDRI